MSPWRTAPSSNISFPSPSYGAASTCAPGLRSCRSRLPRSAEATVLPAGAEQTNVSFIVDDRIMLKVYRRLRSGIQPELEVARFLTDVAGYQNTPALLAGLD